MQIVFLQNSATQPRCHKRFRSFRDIGINGKVYSFNRNWYNANLPKDIEINSLGDLNPGNYFNRLILYIKKLKGVFKENKGSFYYCYGQDMAFVAMIFRQKYIYEESDLMYLEYKSGLMRIIMKKLDKFIQKHSLVTVLTSQGFVEYLYKKIPDNIILIPNKLDGYFLKKERPAIKEFDASFYKFAFIGLLRYEDNIFSFIEIMESVSPKSEFHIWGDSSDEIRSKIIEFCKTHSQAYYHGPFRNPVDLEYIYSHIDINFVCYNAKGRNEQIAEPNKLYESAFFNTPIIVSYGTYLSVVVEKLKTGLVLDCSSKQSIVDFFDNTNREQLRRLSKNCSEIESEELIDSLDPYIKIVNCLSKQKE